MTPPRRPAGAGTPRPCREPGCDVQIVLALRAGTDRWMPLEAQDRPPFTEQSAAAFVLVKRQAWRPLDLIEHFQTSFEISEEKARQVVSGYPFHAPHGHDGEGGPR